MLNLDELCDLLRVLQDPTRLRLLRSLRHGELSVGEAVQVTGLSQPRVSRHLKRLCDARVVRRSPDQNEVYYRVVTDDDRHPLVAAVLAGLAAHDPVIARDRQRLAVILDSRQVRAGALLDRLGVRLLSADELAEVGAVVDDLLAEHRPRTAAGERPGERSGQDPGKWPGERLGDMLDVGTGTGSMLRLLAHRARRTVAVDRSRDMRRVARATVSSAGLANCTVRAGDMYDLEFPDGRFDLVTMDRVLGAAANPALALGEAARVMHDRGRLLVVETSAAADAATVLARRLLRAGLAPLDRRSAVRESVLVMLAAKRGAAGSGPARTGRQTLRERCGTAASENSRDCPETGVSEDSRERPGAGVSEDSRERRGTAASQDSGERRGATAVASGSSRER